MGRKILLGALVGLLALQLIRPTRNLSSTAPGGDDFIVRYSPPAPLADVLRSACYDCHSDNTRYPWYAEVQPVGWWLANHIREGKHELNLSHFGAYSAKLQARKLSAMSDQITNRDMPMPSYTWIHREARLTDAQVNAVSEWLDELHDKLPAAK